MKRRILIMILVFVPMLGGCIDANLKYDRGIDTFDYFGDGRFQITSMDTADGSLSLELMDFDKDEPDMSIDFLYNYKAVNGYLYSIGVKGYTRLDYNSGEFQQSKDVEQFERDEDKKVFQELDRTKKDFIKRHKIIDYGSDNSMEPAGPTGAITEQTPAAPTNSATGPKKKIVITACTSEYPFYGSVDELYKKATYAVKGKVIGSRCEYRSHTIEPSDTSDPRLNPGGDVNQDFKIATTVYTIEITADYKGNAGRTVELQQYGGETDTAIYSYEGIPEIEINEEYIVFLNEYGWPMNIIQALYKVDGDSVTPLRVGGFLDICVKLRRLSGMQ